MTLEGWREAVVETRTDPVLLELMARLLTEQDAAKQALREKGYGCVGQPWLDVVEDVPSR